MQTCEPFVPESVGHEMYWRAVWLDVNLSTAARIAPVVRVSRLCCDVQIFNNSFVTDGGVRKNILT